MTAPTTEKPDTSLHGSNLVLDVENFGPIAEARNIEFKPMTVFVGPSNTGKTYLAVLLHTILRSKPNSYLSSWESNVPRQFSAIAEQPGNYKDLFIDIKKHYFERIELHYHTQPNTFIDLPFRELSHATQDQLKKQTKRRLSGFVDTAYQNICIMFGVKNISSLAFGGHSISNDIRIRLHDQSRHLNFDIISKHCDLDLTNQSLHLLSDLIRYMSRIEFEDYFSLPPWETDLPSIVNSFIDSQFAPVRDSFYFPAGRTGIFNNRFRLASALLGEKPAGQARPFDLLINDFIRMLLMGTDQNGPAVGFEAEHKVAMRLKDSVLGGEIISLDTPVWPEFEYAINGVRIPIERASSMVTEIAGIPLIISAHVKQGDLIIIDEPEAHLHPAAQQQMAAALAFMVRSGLRILITTHSHYMVEQLSNFVAVSTLDESLRKRVLKLGGRLGDEDIYLEESEVGVYDFTASESEHGSTVEVVDFNQDYGYFPRDHNWAIADQMNRTQRVIEARIDQDEPVTAI